jgi:hypothetical protein
MDKCDKKLLPQNLFCFYRQCLVIYAINNSTEEFDVPLYCASNLIYKTSNITTSSSASTTCRRNKANAGQAGDNLSWLAEFPPPQAQTDEHDNPSKTNSPRTGTTPARAGKLTQITINARIPLLSATH